MALDPNNFPADELSRPLPTGFVYRHREDIPGFELRPEVVEAMGARLDDIEGRFHRTPADAQAIVAKDASASVMQHEEITFN